MNITVSENIVLELTAPKHAGELFQAVDNNREHLSRYLPWVGNMQSVKDFDNYINNCEVQYREKTDISFVIISNGKLAGRIGLHHINQQNKAGAIGYWLSKKFEGQGIILQSCKAIIQFGFDQLGLHRIEIKAAVDNMKSQAVPRKLGFTQEGILRQAELVNNQFLDIVLYSMLQQEWQQQS